MTKVGKVSIPSRRGLGRVTSRHVLLTSLFLLPSLVLVMDAAATDAEHRPSHITAIEIRGTLRTQEEIVRRELLFSPGDTVGASQVAETERNLRRLLFLGEVHIKLVPEATPPNLDGHDATTGTAVQSARAVIEVEERYARALSPLLDGDSDELSYGVVALDYNLFGRGQIAEITLFHDAIAGNEIRMTFREPRLAGTRHALSLTANYAGDEGHRLALALSRPFYALSVPWAYGLSLAGDRERQRLYQGGQLAARYDDALRGGSLWLVHSADMGRWKLRPGFRLSFSDRSFDADAPFSYRPDGRRRLIPSLWLTLWHPQYARERFVRGMGQIEDLQTGGWLTLQAGLSSRALGSDLSYPVVALLLAPRGQPTANSFVFGSASISSRWRHGKPWHVIASSAASFYLRVRGRHTLAARVAAHALHRPEDSGSQLLLGVDGGLRGYAPRRFDGSRRLLVNVEARPVFWRHPQAVVGGALFLDGGSAWSPGAPRQWARSAGGGLRVSLPTVYDAPILRADLAYGFVTEASWQLSLGLGQAF